MTKSLTGGLKEKFQVKKTTYGFGLFAKKTFKRGQRLIEYKGERITNEEVDRRGGRYLMILDSKITVDGTSRDNLARYVNHSCKPNCTVYNENNRLFIYAKRRIEQGEELSYDYGKEYWDAYIKPHGCKCGKHACLRFDWFH